MLLKGVRFLITQNSSREIIENHNVSIEGNIITSISSKVEPGSKSERVIDCSNMVALPGLINSHTHAPMNLLRGISDDKPLDRWLREDIFPSEGKLTGEYVYYGTLHAIAEMLLSGTTSFNDMYYFMGDMVKAVKKGKMRAFLARGLTDLEGGGELEGDSKLKRVKEIFKIKSDLITHLVGPHSIYTCSEEFLKKIRDFASENRALIHIHIAETRKEVEECINERGETPVEYLNRIGFLDEGVIGAHGVHLYDEDLAILGEKGVAIVHCPCSNLKLASGVARVSELLSKGIRVGLGTDGAASNNNLNMFEEMKFAALLQKQKLKRPDSISAQQVLDMATVNGAEMLNSNTGSLEEGKLADLILIDLADVTLKPYYGKSGLVSNLVYSFKGAVSHSIVNGEVVVEERALKTIDLEEVNEKVQEFADTLFG